MAARHRVHKERERRAAVHIEKIARGFLGRRRILEMLIVRYKWLLASSLVLASEKLGTGNYAQRMLALPPAGRRFHMLHAIKQQDATSIQKIARGRAGRKRVVHRVKARVETLAFGPDIRRLRASMPEVPRQTGSRCLRKIEIIIIKKHLTSAAQYIQRCYRGRLGRRFMKVLRGHSNMNRIRRVMMPIVLRANAPTSHSGMSSSDDQPSWPKQALPSSRSAAESRRPSSVGDHLQARRPRTRDVLVQPRGNFVSLRTMVNKFADEHAIELPEHMRSATPLLPPIPGAVNMGTTGPVQGFANEGSRENMPNGAGLMQPRPGMAWA